MRRSPARGVLLVCVALLSGLFTERAHAQGRSPGRRKLSAHLDALKKATPHERRARQRLYAVRDPESPDPEVEIFLRVAPGQGLGPLRALHRRVRFGTEGGGIVTAVAPLSALDELEADAGILGVELGRRRPPANDVVRSTQISGGALLGVFANDPTIVTSSGAGVIIGIVDTGIDWCHKDFRKDELGQPNSSRVQYLWDHNDTSGSMPPEATFQNFDSSEYTKSQIDAALAAGCSFATVNSSDTGGHGTHVAGIAGGDGSGNNREPAGKYKGMAPGAEYIIVKTSFSDISIVDGVRYIAYRSAQLGKPAVINLSLGGQGGPHDGTDALETAIGNLAASTPVVIAAGNDHGAGSHAKTSVPASSTVTFSVDASFSFFGYYEAELWHPPGDGYTVTVKLPGCGGTCVTGYVRSANTSGSAVLGVSPATATVTLYNGTSVNNNGDEQILVQVDDPNLVVLGVDIQLGRSSNGGTGTVDGFTHPLLDIFWSSFVNSTLSMTEPGTANNVFTVGSYASKKCWVRRSGFNTCDNSITNLGEISSFSGRGPTRDGRLKPDIAAPGQWIASSSSTWMDGSDWYSDDYSLYDGSHTMSQGTSMAAPVVTGMIALKLQTKPNATVSEIRSMLQSYARSDSEASGLPNNTWGYGKLKADVEPASGPAVTSGTTLGVSSLTFTWSSVSGAVSYNLYYSTNLPKLFLSTTATSLTLTGLPANRISGFQVRGVILGQGPGVETPFLATLAPPPAAAGNPVMHFTSATLAIPLEPASSGYLVQASTDSQFNGTLFSSSTGNNATTSLKVPGLSPLTSYYFRIGDLNALGLVNFGAWTPGGPFMTGFDAVPPDPAPIPFTDIDTATIRFNWTAGANPAGRTYQAEASTAANFTGTVYSAQGVDLFTRLFSSLAYNTSYFFHVRVTSTAGNGPYLNQGPKSTLAVPPAPAVSTFSLVTGSSLRVSWSSNGNSPFDLDTVYEADLSPAADFGSSVQTVSTPNTFADFAGLSGNTLYYARARAVSHGGAPTAYALLSSTYTLAAPVTADSPPFGGVTETALTFRYTSGGNAQGTLFLTQLSTDSLFGIVNAQVTTDALTASFSGLTPNRLYYAQTAAINAAGVPSAFSPGLSTATLPAVPVAPAAPFSTRTVSGLRASWSDARNLAGTLYNAQLADDATFANVVQTSNTANLYADFTGLPANTSFYARVQAAALNPNPDSAFVTLGFVSTLANAPLALPPTFLSVTYTSVTVQWTALPASPASASCEGYRLQLSKDAGFAVIAATSDVAGSASSQGGLAGLEYGTTYYLRVGSLNWEGEPNFTVAGSTVTALPNLATRVVTSAGASLSVTPNFPLPPLLSVVRVEVPPGALPVGTVVTLNASVELELPAEGTNQGRAAALVPLAGFNLSAGGLQPSAPVTIVATYNPALLPPGFKAKYIQLGRYDEAGGQWSLLPTVVDSIASLFVARTDHFSFFSPFGVTAAEDLSGVNVFPIPWEPGSGDARFGAQFLTLTNLPEGARVRVFTLNGELVWENNATPTGTLTWDGLNRAGRRAGTGTYLIVIDGGGQRAVRRAVLVR